MATNPLEHYPRPGVTVDLAILSVVSADTPTPELRVLIQGRTAPDGRALPGGFMRERATIAQTAADVFRRKVGIEPGRAVHPRLLRLFDEPDRDSRTWAISAAHSVSIRETELASARGDLVRIGPDGLLDGEAPLLFDHDAIVTAAVTALRERYEIRRRYADDSPADPDHFLDEPFTLHQLRRVHEAVLGEPLHKDNFNRRMRQENLVKPLLHEGEPVLATNLRGRPAALYVRA